MGAGKIHKNDRTGSWGSLVYKFLTLSLFSEGVCYILSETIPPCAPIGSEPGTRAQAGRIRVKGCVSG